MEAGAHIGRRIPASAGDSAELLGYGRDGAFVVSVSDEDDDAISPVPLEPEPEPQADDEAVELTGFGPLACNTQRQAVRRHYNHRAAVHSTVPKLALPKRTAWTSPEKEGGAGDADADAASPAPARPARSPAARNEAAARSSVRKQRHRRSVERRRRSAGAKGGDEASTSRRRHRRKNRSGVTKAELLARHQLAEPDTVSASWGDTSPTKPHAARGPAAAATSSDSGSEGERQEAGLEWGGMPVPDAAARQPFGARPSTQHRRRAASRAGGPPTPRGKGGGVAAAAAAGAPRPAAAAPPAAGYAAISDAQVCTLREIFDAVDGGRKGWLCREDITQLVRQLGNSLSSKRGTAQQRSPDGKATGRSLARRAGGAETEGGPAGGEEEETIKQDSARGATSAAARRGSREGLLSQAPPLGASDAAAAAEARAQAAAAAAEAAAVAAAEAAAKERLREMRRQRRQEEKDAAATDELLRVLVTAPRAAEPAQAVGSLLPPQHQAPLRISFAEFSGAVDRALDGSGASGGGGDGGARTGELYCRKLLTHWEPEPSLSW